MMNETLKNIAQRYSCRDYKDKPISDDILNAIAQAAIQAPSGMNRQAWRVSVVKNKELMNEIEAEAMDYMANMEDKSAYNRIMERGGKLFYGAPCMIVVSIDTQQYAPALLDCGILCQNIALAATSLGVANVICGLTGMAFASGKRAEEFATRLKFPKDYAFACSVLLGYANTQATPHTPDTSKIFVIE